MDVLKDVILPLSGIAIWIILMVWVLPRFGVST